MSVKREAVLDALSARRLIDKPFTTQDVAEWLKVEEYAVRGAMSWLCVSGVLEVAGSTRRLDKFGRPYDACVYHWHGEMVIPKVRRNRDERLPKAEWDVGCFNLLMGAISTKRRVQPFFRPRAQHPYEGTQWSPEQIDAMRMDETKPAVFNMISLDAGLKRMSEMMNEVAVAPPAKRVQDEVMFKAVAVHGIACSKEWLEPDGSGGLVGMSQRFAYDEHGNLTEVGEPEQTGGSIKL